MIPWSYRSGPELVDIKVGYACNNRCRHCAVDLVQRRLADKRQERDLSTAAVMALIDDAARMNARGIVLTGGEVSIRADFEVLLQHAVARQLSPIIHSNGRAFANRDYAARIAAVPGVAFVVSLHASRADIHDHVTQRKGSFDQTCAGLRNLCDFGSVLVIKLVLLKYNRHEVVPTVTLAKQLRATEFCLAFPYAAPHQLRGVPRYGKVAGEIRAGCLHAEATGLPMSFETVPYCILPALPQMWRQSCDLPRAARTPRVPESDPPLTASARDWDQLRPAMKVKRATCRACVFDPICEGPWREYVSAFGFQEFVPLGSEHVTSLLSLADTSAPPEAARDLPLARGARRLPTSHHSYGLRPGDPHH